MGQTLTHGVYLPNEGERNCYSGLASNWRLLDGAIGTVAAHTTAIAGKADISHTHGNITNDGKVGTTANLPLITGTGGAVQAGSFGNAANTFCEGNDSRLSDARTPVAHTHGKADITDLFNSANVWTGTQTYDAYLKSFGEARADDWSSNSRTNMYLLSRRDTEDVSGFLINTFRSNVAQGTSSHIYGWDILENSIRYSGLRFTMNWNSTLNNGDGAYEITLGTNFQGTNPCNDLHITQLKTINGINPGALSLPDLNTAQTIDRTGWAYDGSTYNAIKLSSTDTNMAKNGWLYVRISSTGSSDKLSIKYNSIGDKYPTSSFGDTGGCIEAFVPVIANSNVYLCATKDLQFCKFYPCQGNV